MPVTQADIDAANAHALSVCKGTGDIPLAEAFAAHREEAVKAALERAADMLEGGGGVIPLASAYAGLVAGNNQPCMSGDMRDRLHSPTRRQFDQITSQVAAAIRSVEASGESDNG